MGLELLRDLEKLFASLLSQAAKELHAHGQISHCTLFKRTERIQKRTRSSSVTSFGIQAVSRWSLLALPDGGVTHERVCVCKYPKSQLRCYSPK